MNNFILKDYQSNSVPTFALEKGFKEKGYEIESSKIESLDDFNILKNKHEKFIAIGGIPFVKKVLNFQNLNFKNLSYPHKNLLQFCDRKFELVPLKEIKIMLSLGEIKTPIFIKPYSNHKIFNGHVVKEFRDLLKTVHINDNETVVTSDFVNFISEYRIFITNGNIVGISNYCGDPLIFPNKFILNKMVKEAYESYNLAGFSVDVGITDDNRTLLVECNDGFCLGNYGLNYLSYTTLVEERWKQAFKEIT